MKNLKIHSIFFNLLLGALLFAFSDLGFASPPSRVARLSDITGKVSFLPADITEWVEATRNRPLTTGDKLWVDKGSRAKLQLDTALICIGPESNVVLMNLDDKIAQFQVSQGKLNIHIKKFVPNQTYEIDTPNLAFSFQKPGDYQIDVDTEGNTLIAVYQGEGTVYGQKTNFSIGENQSYRFSGTEDLKQDSVKITQDDFDMWCFAQKSARPKYVSLEVIGSEDLDSYGKWIHLEPYGYVWEPSDVAADWAPYHDGHWIWVAPWGWTWVDDAPWGFAPFHYGRWVFVAGHWHWIPGPIEAEAIYAPALVEFMTLENGIGWFPLGYNEVYWPPYAFNRDYFVNINKAGVSINVADIGILYNKGIKEQTFQNLKISHAITAVPTSVFTNAGAVSKSALKVSPEALTKAKLSPNLKITPTKESIIGPAKPALAKPSAIILKRPTIIKTTPSSEVKGISVKTQVKTVPITPAKIMPSEVTKLPSSKKIHTITVPEATKSPAYKINKTVPIEPSSRKIQKSAPQEVIQYNNPKIESGLKESIKPHNEPISPKSDFEKPENKREKKK